MHLLLDQGDGGRPESVEAIADPSRPAYAMYPCELPARCHGVCVVVGGLLIGWSSVLSAGRSRGSPLA